MHWILLMIESGFKYLSDLSVGTTCIVIEIYGLILKKNVQYIRHCNYRSLNLNTKYIIFIYYQEETSVHDKSAIDIFQILCNC